MLYDAPFSARFADPYQSRIRLLVWGRSADFREGVTSEFELDAPRRGLQTVPEIAALEYVY